MHNVDIVEQFGNGETVVARASTCDQVRRRGIEPEGEKPPPLGRESEVLYRTVVVYKWNPYGLNQGFEEVPYGIEFQRTVVY
jgi:hypothetical protein